MNRKTSAMVGGGEEGADDFNDAVVDNNLELKK